MKRRIFLTVALFALLSIAVSLSSCGKRCKHEYSKEETTAPTCLEDGVNTYTCKKCGDSYTETVNALGHDVKDHEAQAPTCAEVGWEAYEACSRCDYSTKVEKPATDAHSIINGCCIRCNLPISTPGLEYSLNSDGQTYTVTGIGTCEEMNVVIGLYNNRRVTSIGSCAFEYRSSIKSVVIGYSVTTIGERAFYDCDGLKSIVIPDSVTSIGEYAFNSCDSLVSMEIPSSITSIGEYAFNNCDSLVRIVIPESATSIGPSAFAYCDMLESITVDKNNRHYKDIDGNLYTKDEKILIQYAIRKDDKTFVIPDSVTSVGEWAFAGCESLVSIEIPYGVTSIGKYAFDDCESLASIEIPDSVTNIGEGAFYGCESLVSIEIPYGVTSIGEYAFNSCDSLTIYCEAASKPSEWNSNWNQSNRPVVWGYNNITTNSEYDYVVHNGKAGLTKYKRNATSVVVPSAIDGYEVVRINIIFAENDVIKSVILPNSITSISPYAFDSCDSLESIDIPDSVTSIGGYAFSSCDSLVSITVDKNNQHYKDIDGNLYTKDGKILIQYAIRKNDKTFAIPDGVTSIGDNAFRNCDSLESIEIPESVTSIGDEAFSDCKSLVNIDIPDGVTSIGYEAFYNCESLVSIEISDSVTSIGSAAFYSCDSLVSIVIPDSVTSIGKYAFNNCDSLVSIVIPDSVTSIGYEAFYDCDTLTIYCEAASKPSEWDSNWNWSNCPVVWGYIGA